MERIGHFEDLANWNPRMALAAALLASIAFAAIWFILWPTELMWDDGAIVLRYMDNFAEGHPYRYNADGPPVFGVSGFVHCTLAGLVATSGLLSPENSLHLSGGIGLALTVLAFLLILRRFSSSSLTIVVGCVFTVTACYHLLVNAFQGLEASLHLGIVLMTCWAFLSARWRTMWALMALSIISKLDAAPVAAVLVLLRATSLRTRTDWASEFRRAVLWCGLPLLGWIAFASWYFGSPLPQSAAAKLQYHYHPPRPVDFVLQWWEWDPFRIAGYWSIIVASVVWAVLRRKSMSSVLVLPLACVSVLVLYMIYNPGERMQWYYVLPQALLVLGAVCASFSLLRDRRRVMALMIVVVGLGAALPTTTDRARRRVRSDLDYIRGVEPQRIAVGSFVHERARAGERLLTGHGYVARYARIHTHDLSGLNSPEVTRLRAERKYIPDALQPDWIAFPAHLPWDTQTGLGYRLEHVFYDRAARGMPSWRIWRRIPGELVLPAIGTDVLAGEVTAKPEHLSVSSMTGVGLAPRSDFPVEALAFGIVRKDVRIRVSVLSGGAPVADHQFEARDWSDPVTGASGAIRVELEDPSLPVEIRVTDADGSPLDDEFVVLEPAWLITRDPGGK